MPPSADQATFELLRPRLYSIAYRMLGTRSDAEDLVQDAWLRWNSSQPDGLMSAEAWLVTVVTRLSIDRLRSRKVERAAYVGWWLPEPLVDIDASTPETAADMASQVSVAMLWVMERLSPEERAAFLMRKILDQDYADLAYTLGKTEAACRQLVHRAEKRIRDQQPRFTVSREGHRDVLASFMQAARHADRNAMKMLLSDDVQFRADGGGKVEAIDKVLAGAGRVAGLYWAVENAFRGKVDYRMANVNGEPGLVRYIDGKVESVQAFRFENGAICAIYAVRNPDKLAHVPSLQSFGTSCTSATPRQPSRYRE
jgi:RNA polymerase sigma-70 factor (ECF subfamily)